MTVDQYLEYVTESHKNYIYQQHKHGQSTQQHHLVDLSIESASFFESAFQFAENLENSFFQRNYTPPTQHSHSHSHSHTTPADADIKYGYIPTKPTLDYLKGIIDRLDNLLKSKDTK